MSNKICACCGLAFEKRPQVPNQTYCSLPACQRARRQRWQRDKMQTDPDYRDNQSRNQRAWLDRHPEYWRNYREANPEYVDRNKSRQRSKHDLQQEVDLAKMDVSRGMALRPGLYRIEQISNGDAASSEAWIVEITPLNIDCPCKKDGCKDRT
ncbi:hypothetical protein [Pseudomonas sp. GL-B-19]|uniref:hypothetical protein n=1 Tax=Pseudomonas sp. GL-B-19 TaxID=2832393 RepID=UPI001CC17379|nr:hypothetical protein [Pseudomonas sp. GL-B-19]